MARVDTDVTLGGRYRLVRRIASGGMGSVWEAEDETLHRRVAVKVLSDALASDERFLERFRREARAAAGLSHTNVAPVFDYGEDGDTAYIVLELIDGETLARRLRRGGRLDPAEAVRIASGIAAALQAAHDAGIVHRDVKPGNVMLTRAGGVRVMDFGIAAASWATPLTGAGSAIGTATYIAPEQAQGARATPASDVYALGVVLYEMLTGRPPFERETPVATATAHVNDPPTPVLQLSPSVPSGVAAACERALAKDPAARPASAALFASMLETSRAVGHRDAGAGGVTGPIEVTEATEVTEVFDRPQRTVPLPAATTAAGAAGTGPLPVGGQPPMVRSAPRGRGPRVGVWILVAVLALAAVVAIVMVASRKQSGPSSPNVPTSSPAAPQQITVPNVVGLSRAEAETALSDRGLKAVVLEVPGKNDVVRRSDPAAGATVEPGSSVTLFVGSGENGEGDHRSHGKGKGGD